MPTSGYRLRPQAVSDLEEIYVYSRREFGEARAATYVSALEQGFQSLASNQQLGPSRDDVSRGLRALRIQSHYVFYRIVEDGIVIVRVLHTSRDYKSHL